MTLPRHKQRDWRKKMIEIGRVCVKTAGRDAGMKCVVVDILDKGYVLIDGQTRRRKCNILHLEPLDLTIKVTGKASHDLVVSALKEAGIDIKERKKKEVSERPRKVRKRKKVVEEKEKKPVKEKKKKAKTSKAENASTEKKETTEKKQ